MNKLYTGNNLTILKSMKPCLFDLIYLDPPFASQKDYKADSGAFTDKWKGSDNLLDLPDNVISAIQVAQSINGDGFAEYMAFMAERILELHRVLKDNGTLYLHCDQTASHYLKILLDIIFGADNFRNELIWCYSSPSASKKNHPKKHDTIYRYTKSDEFTFNMDAIRIPHIGLHAGGIGNSNTSKEYREEQLKKGKAQEDWIIGVSPVGRIRTENLKYPTQKPLKLLDIIVKSASNPEDRVLDPFCGSATTLESADNNNREWCGIDLNDVSNLIDKRMPDAVYKHLHRP